MAEAKMKVVFECHIDVSKIQEAVEKVRAALLELGETCAAVGESMTGFTRNDAASKRSAFGAGPEIGSLWVLNDGRDQAFEVIDPAEDRDRGPFAVVLRRLTKPHDVRTVSVAALEQDFEPLSDGRVDILGVRVPAPGSVWEFADDRDPGGVWRVPHDYRGDTTMVSLHRVDGPPAPNGDVSATWHGSVANHNNTFRRFNG